MIVVDTNVVAYLFLRGEFAPRAEEWLKRDRDWVAPSLWRSEFRNLLAGYLRRKQLTFETVREIQCEAEALLMSREHEVDSQRVLELVRDSDCSAYDCEFVSVAMRLGVKLLTADSKVLMAFPLHTMSFSGRILRRTATTGCGRQTQ
jgi:predicted nucleic acid-binding protein